MGYTDIILDGSDTMAKLKSKVNRFFYRNRSKGVRNLMLYIGVGNLVVWLLTMLNPSEPFFYELLRLSPAQVLSGQVWRLFTYPLVYLCESTPILGILSMLFFYWCGSILEQYWGTLRFNAYYLSGVLLTDLAAVAVALVALAEDSLLGLMISSVLGVGFIGYVNFSLLLAAATVIPEEQVRIWFILPVKMKWLAWIDLGFTLYEMIRGLISVLKLGSAAGLSMYLLLLIPLVAVANYLLFFGKQAANILPDFLRYHPTHKSWTRQMKQQTAYSDAGLGRSGPRGSGAQARFRCTVCGRTELSNPGLEFRYCSKCAGYRCYCQDHIHNHEHITE